MARCAYCGDSDKPNVFKPYDLGCWISSGEACPSCVGIYQLESQIQEAKQALDLMFQRHYEMKRQINRSHDPMAGRLPPEIVLIIFQFCMPDIRRDTQGLWKFSSKEIATPLTLGAVCQHWRYVAWSTPELWTVIKVDLDASHLRLQCHLARDWLSRSGSQLPLSIRIFASRSGQRLKHPGSAKIAREFIHTLNRYSDRWRLLDLSIPPYLFPTFCGDSLASSILRTLQLEAIPQYAPGENFKFNRQKVKLKPEVVFLSDLPLRAVNIEWDNVTQVKLQGLPPRDCFRLLKRALQLKDCTFYDIGLDRAGNHPTATDTISHSQLTVLDVSSQYTLDPFFTRVAFPALEELSYDTMQEGYNISITTLISLIKRSSSRLRKLRIEDITVDQIALISLLEVVPFLWQLEIVTGTSSALDSLFNHLAMTSIANDSDTENDEQLVHFLPELQFLRFQIPVQPSCKFIPAIFGPLFELDNRRRRPLHTILVHFEWREDDPIFSIDKEIMRDILSILGAGLNLEILYLYHQPPLDLIRASMDDYGVVTDINEGNA
ncbi:hypothetical protein GALMADRAFT_235027 [Galerina marginata CBS 339.88]|uniref:Uncharacterized protein n=1 Tax=Galerina marginata (strain CBS 339.88) TaxID=685588 RepID=A0A067TRP1_GALM3|nr:hypothetical protein GALMADRAFT_235027 [Galerina marginata CBS 339.88]